MVLVVLVDPPAEVHQLGSLAEDDQPLLVQQRGALDGPGGPVQAHAGQAGFGLAFAGGKPAHEFRHFVHPSSIPARD
jgi:hypothetical protein